MVYDRRMIQLTITYRCRICGSTNIVRNGTNRCGSAQYYCKDCGTYRVLEPATGYLSPRNSRFWTPTRNVPVCGGWGASLA